MFRVEAADSGTGSSCPGETATPNGRARQSGDRPTIPRFFTLRLAKLEQAHHIGPSDRWPCISGCSTVQINQPGQRFPRCSLPSRGCLSRSGSRHRLPLVHLAHLVQIESSGGTQLVRTPDISYRGSIFSLFTTKHFSLEMDFCFCSRSVRPHPGVASLHFGPALHAGKSERG